MQRQYCGETGKIDNFVFGQQLLFMDNQPSNPFCCMLHSDLYLPKGWPEDRPRCQEADRCDDRHRTMAAGLLDSTVAASLLCFLPDTQCCFLRQSKTQKQKYRVRLATIAILGFYSSCKRRKFHQAIGQQPLENGNSRCSTKIVLRQSTKR